MIEIENWMKSNKLTTNHKKYCFMIICKNSVNVDGFKLTLQNSSINKERSAKYLGVHVDSKLPRKLHIDYLEKKFFKSMWRNL